MAYVLKFEPEKCVGCLTCHTACISSQYPAKKNAPSFRTMQKLVNEEVGFQKTVCPGCTHCGRCQNVCHVQAIHKDETGFVLIDAKKCTGCRKCEAICPLAVIRFDKEGRAVKCDGCITFIRAGKEPVCARNCPTGAIVMEKR